MKQVTSILLGGDHLVSVSLLALLLVGSFLVLSHNTGLNLTDEGYLWYGAWRTRMGEIPLLDFQSYDPGRYLYLAATSFLFGESLLGLRISLTLFQWVGLTVGLLALRRVVQSWLVLAAIGFAVVWSMYPSYKLFDAALALAATYVGLRLLESPTTRMHFLAGLYVGLAAVMGRNHGVYALLAFATLILFRKFKATEPTPPRSLAAFVGGIVLGYSPMLVGFFGVPGFFQAFVESVRANIEMRHINLPVPWPWREYYGSFGPLDYGPLAPLAAVSQLALGVCYLLVFSAYVLSLLYLLWFRWKPDNIRRLLLVSSVTGLVYMHHAFGRSELSHLAQTIPPFALTLAAIVCLVAPPKRTAVALLIAGVCGGVTLLAVGLAQPVVQRAVSPAGEWVDRVIEDEIIYMDRRDAEVLDRIRELDRTKFSGESVLLAPNLPALYRILRRKSPTWEIYFVLPTPAAANERSARQMIQNRVRYVILVDIPLDGKDTLRFRNTHPELYQFIRRYYEEVPGSRLPGSYRLYERRVLE